jgi:hypothetical protein
MGTAWGLSNTVPHTVNEFIKTKRRIHCGQENKEATF